VTTAAVPSGWRARTFASLGVPLYRRFFVGLLFTLSGFWVRTAAAGWWVYETTASTERLGWITAAGLLPWVPLAPLAGVLADRTDARRLLLASQAGVFLVNAVLALGLWLGRVGFGEMLLATVLSGSLRAVENPVRQGVARRLVGVAGLSNAIGLNAAAFQCTQALGFALAGQIYAWWGPAACFAAVSLLTLPMLGTLLALGPIPPPTRAVLRRPLADLGEGFAYVWRHRLVRAVVGGAAAVILLLLSFRSIMPAIAKDGLGLDAEGYGLLMALMGVGALIGALWVAAGVGGRHRRLSNLFLVALFACGAVTAVALGRTVWVMAPALLVTGFCHVAFLASSNATVQELVPDALRGRVMGIWALVFGAVFPLGGLLVAWAAERFGTQATLLAGAALGLLALTTLWVRLRRRGGIPRLGPEEIAEGVV
jgi:MFS family permease